jgi:hypothetical protein
MLPGAVDRYTWIGRRMVGGKAIGDDDLNCPDIEAVRSVKKLRQIARQNAALVVTGHDCAAWPAFLRLG